MDSSTYTAEALRKVCALLKVATFWKDKLTISTGGRPGLYLITVLGEEHHHIYHQLVGMTEWMVHIGRFDTILAVTPLNRF